MDRVDRNFIDVLGMLNGKRVTIGEFGDQGWLSGLLAWGPYGLNGNPSWAVSGIEMPSVRIVFIVENVFRIIFPRFTEPKIELYYGVGVEEEDG